MKKKVFVLILALFVLMPVSGVFAEEVDIQTYTNLYDNHVSLDNIPREFKDISNRFVWDSTGSKTYFMNFSMPMYIENFYIKKGWYSTSASPKMILRIYRDDKETEIIEVNDAVVGTDLILSIDMYSVTRIELTKSISTIMGDFIGFNGYLSPEIIPEIINYSVEVDKYTTLINWDDPEFDVYGYQIEFNDSTNIVSDNYYEITNLKPNTDYEAFIKVIDKEMNMSEGIKIEFKTMKLEKQDIEEVKEVNAEASHDRIDLSWSLPETEYFEHVNIYRKSVSEVQTFSLLSVDEYDPCLLYTSPSPRDRQKSRMPSSA